MRLSNRIVNILKENILKSFGKIDIYLFGSRVDDTKKGGDIDIALDINIPRDEFRKKRSKLIASLLRINFDLKIDIVQYNKRDMLLFDEIQNNSIKLN